MSRYNGQYPALMVKLKSNFVHTLPKTLTPITMIEPINMGHNARNSIVYDCVILTACNGYIFVGMQLNAIMLPDKLDAYNEIVRLAFRKKIRNVNYVD